MFCKNWFVVLWPCQAFPFRLACSGHVLQNWYVLYPSCVFWSCFAKLICFLATSPGMPPYRHYNQRYRNMYYQQRLPVHQRLGWVTPAQQVARHRIRQASQFLNMRQNQHAVSTDYCTCVNGTCIESAWHLHRIVSLVINILCLSCSLSLLRSLLLRFSCIHRTKWCCLCFLWSYKRDKECT